MAENYDLAAITAFVLENPEYLEDAAENPEKLSETLAFKFFEIEWHARQVGGIAGRKLQYDIAKLRGRLAKRRTEALRRYFRS